MRFWIIFLLTYYIESELYTVLNDDSAIEPTIEPTPEPSLLQSPSRKPSRRPSQKPVPNFILRTPSTPSKKPTFTPTNKVTTEPTVEPSAISTMEPTSFPSKRPQSTRPFPNFIMGTTFSPSKIPTFSVTNLPHPNFSPGTVSPISEPVSILEGHEVLFFVSFTSKCVYDGGTTNSSYFIMIKCPTFDILKTSSTEPSVLSGMKFIYNPQTQQIKRVDRDSSLCVDTNQNSGPFTMQPCIPNKSAQIFYYDTTTKQISSPVAPTYTNPFIPSKLSTSQVKCIDSKEGILRLNSCTSSAFQQFSVYVYRSVPTAIPTSQPSRTTSPSSVSPVTLQPSKKLTSRPLTRPTIRPTVRPTSMPSISFRAKTTSHPTGRPVITLPFTLHSVKFQGFCATAHGVSSYVQFTSCNEPFSDTQLFVRSGMAIKLHAKRNVCLKSSIISNNIIGLSTSVCSSVATDQQFTYIPQTKQIKVQGSEYCVDGGGQISAPFTVSFCDQSKRDQKFNLTYVNPVIWRR